VENNIIPTLIFSHNIGMIKLEKGEFIMDQVIQQLRPDAKGRISLGKLAQGISSFHARRMDDGSIILDPFIEIPAREQWLLNNQAALGSVKRGISQAATGNTREIESFAQYAEEDIE